jgi:hypothetical protein
MKRLAVISLVAVSAASFGQVWSGGGGSIADNATASSTIAGVPGLTGVSAIAILGATHSWAGDVTFAVTHVASNTTYSLVTRVGRVTSGFGDSSNLGADYVFVATGGGDFWAAAAAAGSADPIPGGGYNATGADSSAPTGLFPGAWAASDWRLDVTDSAGGDTGSWQGWEIRGTAVPEPATMAVLGLGAVALIRRRIRK